MCIWISFFISHSFYLSKLCCSGGYESGFIDHNHIVWRRFIQCHYVSLNWLDLIERYTHRVVRFGASLFSSHCIGILHTISSGKRRRRRRWWWRLRQTKSTITHSVIHSLATGNAKWADILYYFSFFFLRLCLFRFLFFVLALLLFFPFCSILSIINLQVRSLPSILDLNFNSKCYERKSCNT